MIINEKIMTSNQRITELRKSDLLKNDPLEKLIGIPKSSFYHWEKNDYGASTDAIIKLADYFGTSTDYILGRTEQKTYTMLPEIQALIDFWNGSNQLVRDELKKFMLELCPDKIDKISQIK